MKVISIHKTENRGTKQRVLAEFEADSVPTNGWLQFFTELFAQPVTEPAFTSVVDVEPVTASAIPEPVAPEPVAVTEF